MDATSQLQRHTPLPHLRSFSAQEMSPKDADKLHLSSYGKDCHPPTFVCPLWLYEQAMEVCV